MAGKNSSVSRRRFLKTAGAVSIGSLLSPLESLTDAQAKSDSNDSQPKVVPTRALGKTGVNVPILCLGSAFYNRSDLLLKQSIKMGVHFWETAAMYMGGNAERAIGKYFTKNPGDRKKVFLGTKSYSVLADHWSADLDKSLKRMNTSHIDLFLVHGVTFAQDLIPPSENSELWAEKNKSQGKIRFFGFSTHKNVEDNLMKASKYGWIDAIMFSYNFRTMHSDKMKKAVDACAKAGVGLIAMKTQASGHMGYTEKISPNEKEQALFNQLAQKGMTLEQAKLKAVWDDERIASITSGMPNLTLLQANVAAAVNDIKLSWRNPPSSMQVFRR